MNGHKKDAEWNSEDVVNMDDNARMRYDARRSEVYLERKAEREEEDAENAKKFRKWLPLGILILVILNSIFSKPSKTEEAIQNLKDQERATRKMGKNE